MSRRLRRVVPLLPTTNLHLRFIPPGPEDGRCAICGRARGAYMRCERCGCWLHVKCWRDRVANAAERQIFEEADDDGPTILFLCQGCRS